MTTVVSLVVVVAAVGVTLLALLGRADAKDRERVAVEREEAAIERSQGQDPAAGLLGAPSLSDREEELRAYFRYDVLSAVNLVQSAVASAACDAAIAGRDVRVEELADEVAGATDLPDLVALPDDEWRALIDTSYAEEELVRCRAGF